MHRRLITAAVAVAVAAIGFTGTASAWPDTQGPVVSIDLKIKRNGTFVPANPNGDYVRPGGKVVYSVRINNSGDAATGPMVIRITFGRYFTIINDPRRDTPRSTTRRANIGPNRSRAFVVTARLARNVPSGAPFQGIAVDPDFVE